MNNTVTKVQVGYLKSSVILLIARFCQLTALSINTKWLNDQCQEVEKFNILIDKEIYNEINWTTIGKCMT